MALALLASWIMGEDKELLESEAMGVIQNSGTFFQFFFSGLLEWMFHKKNLVPGPSMKSNTEICCSDLTSELSMGKFMAGQPTPP